MEKKVACFSHGDAYMECAGRSCKAGGDGAFRRGEGATIISGFPESVERKRCRALLATAVQNCPGPTRILGELVARTDLVRRH